MSVIVTSCCSVCSVLVVFVCSRTVLSWCPLTWSYKRVSLNIVSIYIVLIVYKTFFKHLFNLYKDVNIFAYLIGKYIPKHVCKTRKVLVSWRQMLVRISCSQYVIVLRDGRHAIAKVVQNFCMFQNPKQTGCQDALERRCP